MKPSQQKLEGKNVSFIATRIQHGNPVKGKVVKQYKNGDIEVELEHSIEGLVNMWNKGSKKIFKQDLITNLEVL